MMLRRLNHKFALAPQLFVCLVHIYGHFGSRQGGAGSIGGARSASQSMSAISPPWARQHGSEKLPRR
jgi:hypothetical protein